MKTKFFLLLASIFTQVNLWACPTCAGSGNNKADVNTVIILACFIVLTYVPFYLIFRLIKKYQHISPTADE